MKNWSRKKKLLLCIPILLISLFLIASITEWPSPTLEIAIRRKEKQQLIGPSELISIMDVSGPWDHLVLSKTEFGYLTYEYRDDLGWDEGNLSYYPREENCTIFCTYYWYRRDEKDWLPILLFPEEQRSAKSKMSLTITADGEVKSYQLDGERKHSSYYLFAFPIKEMGGTHYWLLQQALTGAYQEFVLTGTVEIHIDFYDRQGNLVDTYSKTVTK